jgi:hypothetical protein
MNRPTGASTDCSNGESLLHTRDLSFIVTCLQLRRFCVGDLSLHSANQSFRIGKVGSPCTICVHNSRHTSLWSFSDSTFSLALIAQTIHPNCHIQLACSRLDCRATSTAGCRHRRPISYADHVLDYPPSMHVTYSNNHFQRPGHRINLA